MPSCCIKNCKSRTSGSRKTKHVKFFMFPQDVEVKEKWLKACQMEISSGLVCEQHFTPDCIEERMSQPRLPNVEPRLIRQLKPGSVPTVFLNLPKTRRTFSLRSVAENDERESQGKRTCRTGVPTYSELIDHIRNEKDNSNIVTDTQSDTNTELETSGFIDLILNEKENSNESLAFTDLTISEFSNSSEVLDYILKEKENFDVSNKPTPFSELIASTELASEIAEFTELTCNESSTPVELERSCEFISSTELVSAVNLSTPDVFSSTEFATSEELLASNDFTSTELLADADIAACVDFISLHDAITSVGLPKPTEFSSSIEKTASEGIVCNDHSITPTALTETVPCEDPVFPLSSQEPHFVPPEDHSLHQRVKQLEEQNENLMRENKLLMAQNHRLILLLQEEFSCDEFLQRLKTFEIPNSSPVTR